jgi:nucleotide-binding universal stress UspA family protein
MAQDSNVAQEPNTGVIVAGVDGSDSSLEALRWAARQAEVTGAALEVLASWEYPTSFGWAPPLPSDWDPEAETRKSLQEAIDTALGPDRSIEIRQTVVEEHAAPALVAASKHADLLVVGSRGHGEFVGMLIGSVSEYCVTQASCPVVVVRH